MPKRILCMLLVLGCLLSCALAEEGDPGKYAYGRDFHWGASLEEALALLGDDAVHDEDSDPAIGTMDMVRVQADAAYGIEDVLITAAFFDDALMMIGYLFPDEGISDVQVLVDMVSAELGEANMYGEKVSLTDLIDGTKTICDWKKDENTEAELIRESADAGDYLLFISNAEVVKMFEERLMESAA